MSVIINFTETHIQQALTRMREFEMEHLGNPVQGFNNPFRRPGVMARDVAWACGFLQEGETQSGKRRVDVPAARRLLKMLVENGLVESMGGHRTRAAGSPNIECFALKGFAVRLESAKEAWLNRA